MKTINLQIEKSSKFDSSIVTLFAIYRDHGYEQMMTYNKYHVGLMIGKGGHHIWFKDPENNERLAIIYKEN